MTLSRLAALGLGPEPTVENLAHEKTTHQSKYRPYIYIITNFVGGHNEGK